MFLKQFESLINGNGGKMIEAALDEVREAEREADRLLEAEKQKSAKLVADARNKAAQHVKDSEGSLDNKNAQVIERQKEKIVATREKVLADGLDRLKLLRKSADKRTAEAVDFVLEAFEKELA